MNYLTFDYEKFFRRTVMTRQRLISALSATIIDPYHFRLRLTTQAGAYVKEFVHGDFGRTKPNLTMILDRFVDILELDVLVCESIFDLKKYLTKFFIF
jgi:tRNA U54 and U55 pseudouridine synthase Pus10